MLYELVRSRLEADPRILAAWMFGSRARGVSSVSSDLDVAVLLDHPPRSLAELPFDLADRLQEELGLDTDLVILNNAPPELVRRVLAEGVRLVDRNRAARLAFEVRFRNDGP